MRQDTIKAAHGRWREILSCIGIDPKFLTKKPGPCPMCGGTDRWSFDDRTGEGDYVCRACGAGKGLQLAMKFKRIEFKEAANEIDKIIGNLPPSNGKPSFETTRATDPRALRLLYGESKPIYCEDAVGRYLFRRQLHEPYSKALRYVPEMLHYPTRTKHPGMIATFTGPDDRPATIHRTYLTHDGRKADIDPPRMFMRGAVAAGGAIRLHPVDDEMGIAEGIETALSARDLFEMPVWATTSAAMLAAWQAPAHVKRIVVYGDSDYSFTGQAAAYALAKRLVMEAERDKIERVVEVMLPPLGQDWNDVLMEGTDEESKGANDEVVHA